MQMNGITIAQAAQAVGGKLIGGGDNPIRQVVMDSRKDVSGALFVAIAGSRADGHDYVARVLDRGAAGCLIERESAASPNGPCILVDSTLRAIRDLAGWYRRRFSIPVVGVTGSVGKTSTKEMVAAVLGAKYKVHKTEGNLNNEIGVPMTLFGLTGEHEVAVVEMGISAFGEMTRLTDMVRPDIVVMSIIGYSHLQDLGDRDGVLRAKAEILSGMADDGLLVVNGDDDLLRAMRVTDFAPEKTGVEKRVYGMAEGNAYRAVDIENRGEGGMACTIRWGDTAMAAEIPAFGQHMVYAALAATAVGDRLGLTPEEIARGIGNFKNVGKRADMVKTDYLTIVDDCYNANPNSVRAALDSLAGLPGRRVAVLGDMGELGDESPRLHAQMGEHAARSGIDCLICIGEMSRHTYQRARETKPNLELWHFPEKAEALAVLPSVLRRGDSVLVKASRFMQFEEIVAELKKL